MLSHYLNIPYLAETMGFEVGLMTYIIGIFMTFPLGFVMSCIPFGFCKHLSAATMGAYLLYFTLGNQWLHILGTTTVSYIMIVALPRSVIKTALPIFAMAYCSYAHINRQFADIEWDFACAQMMLTIKLYSLAWNLWDGEQIQTINKDKWTRATTNNKQFAVYKTPSLVEFFGYCLNFSTCLIGPVYEFATYKKICDGELVLKYYKQFGKFPSRVKHVLTPLLTALFFAGYHLYFTNNYYILKDGMQHVCGKSIFYLLMTTGVFKAKFYFAWKAMEAANNIWYAGFEGVDKDGKIIGWEHTNNIDIWEIETASNMKTFTRSWNKKTSNWLNRYIHQRHKGNALIVYSVSAIWHGFYPGYYITFLTAAFTSLCEQLGRKRITPLFGDSIIYKFACIIMIQLSVTYALIPFVLLSFNDSYEALKCLYFSGHIVIVLFYFVLRIWQ